MRSEENPLDLNNLPEDCSKDGKQVQEDFYSYAGYRKKKSGAKEGKEESEKVYECRFCSLKFCKSQALGGHMNRHRQGKSFQYERETETLNRARQLVFNNDTLLGPGPPHPHHLGGQSIPHGGGYHHQPGNIPIPDPSSMQFRSVYQPRLFSGSATATLLPQPPPQHYMYSSPTRLVPFSAGSHHYQTTMPGNNHDYFLGHVVPPNATAGENTSPTPNNYTCIGAPVSLPPRHGFGSVGDHDRDQEGGGALGWGATRTTTTTQPMEKHRFDAASINQFQDGF